MCRGRFQNDKLCWIEIHVCTKGENSRTGTIHFKISPKRWWLLQLLLCSVSSIGCTRTQQTNFFMQNNHKNTCTILNFTIFCDLYLRANLGKIFVLNLLGVCFGFDDNVIIIIIKKVFYFIICYAFFTCFFFTSFHVWVWWLFSFSISRYSRCTDVLCQKPIWPTLGRYFFLIATTTKIHRKHNERKFG